MLPDHYEYLLLRAEADTQGLRSTSKEQVQLNIDLVFILTGEGPRKTTAFGMALRGIGHSYKVSVTMFVEDKPD
jgi:ATP:corrinoid adenosyltransferase